MVKPSADKHQQASENTRNNNDVKFKGVRKRKWGKWVSEIRLPNSRERIWLGSYDTPEKAARAFDAALYCLRGNQAKFNFPDNPPEIDGGRSLKPQEIQAVAAKFANETPLSFSSSSSSSKPEPESHITNDFDQFNITSPASWPFLDYSMMTGSDCSTPDFGNFGGIDDFAGDFLTPELNFNVNYDDQDDGIYSQDGSQSSFLWNF